MAESQADRISRLQREVQDKRVNAATLQAKKDELQRRLDEMKKECHDSLGIEPEGLEGEIVRLTSIIEQKIGSIQTVLSGAG